MAGPKAFSALQGISKEALAVLESQGFKTATPVQEATIPLFAGNKDVAVDACTGSGKTLAFVVPVVEKMRKLEQRLKRHQVRRLLITAPCSMRVCVCGPCRQCSSRAAPRSTPCMTQNAHACDRCLQVGAIIVSPTRELARQIYTVACPFVSSVPWLSTMLLVGGT